jgi:signal transduction histidine kinase
VASVLSTASACRRRWKNSSQLNEELQVQQEELRTANEELEEQSRALEESQSALENQQAELEQTNEQLAEQAGQPGQQERGAVQAQDQLRERALELERASRYKSEFLANMSHELQHAAEQLADPGQAAGGQRAGNLNDEQVRFAQTIYSAGNDLLNLINDILDISKVEAGKLDWCRKTCRCAAWSKACAHVRAAGQAEGADFDLTGRADVPPPSTPTASAWSRS